jgi:hypothetical protein
MSKVTYEYLFGKEPLYPTYMQLQMADQLVRFPKGIAKDVMVKIQDYYVPTDFLVLDMLGEEDEETPIILGRPFLNTNDAIIYIGSGQVHFQLPNRKVRCNFNSYTNHEQPKKPCNRRRRRSRRQATQPLKDRWADYPGDVSRYEDRYGQDDEVEKKEDTPPIQATMIWKEKKATPTAPPQEEQSSESSLDDAPDDYVLSPI